jgi:hypothetical protein
MRTSPTWAETLAQVTSGADQPNSIADSRLRHLLDFLRKEIWPITSGSPAITTEEHDNILGYETPES